MQTYIKLLGGGLNFFGGPGEAVHKIFVKAAGQKTQQRLFGFCPANFNTILLHDTVIARCRKTE